MIDNSYPGPLQSHTTKEAHNLRGAPKTRATSIESPQLHYDVLSQDFNVF